jgi:hypothetical protein
VRIGRFVLLVADLFLLLVADRFFLLFVARFLLIVVVLVAPPVVLMTASTCVCSGCRDPEANDGDHADDDDCSIHHDRQQPQS